MEDNPYALHELGKEQILAVYHQKQQQYYNPYCSTEQCYERKRELFKGIAQDKILLLAKTST